MVSLAIHKNILRLIGDGDGMGGDQGTCAAILFPAYTLTTNIKVAAISDCAKQLVYVAASCFSLVLI